MNQLIQTLAEVAKKSVPHGLGVEEWIKVYNEKFAELILRECKLFCGHDSEGVSAMFKHFGVEE